jgi:hypothetical protein
MGLNERLMVGTPEGPRSNVWRLHSRRNDVYVTTGGIGKQKFSFHASGKCRQAYHELPPSLPDRAIARWWRMPTPEPNGTGKASCVLQVGIPTDLLSTRTAPLKAMTWVAPAPIGMATVLEMIFTREAEGDLAAAMTASQRTIVCQSKLPSGETFLVLSRHATWEQPDFYMPASQHVGEDFLFTKDDPDKTGRPVRLAMFNSPKDFDSMVGWEFGGYRAPSTKRAHLDTLNREHIHLQSGT